MKKIFSSTVFAVFFLSIFSSVVFAGNLEINNFFAESLSTPLTGVDALAYACADSVCSSHIGGPFFEQNSGASNQLTIEFPGTEEPQRYAEFFLAQCYIPLAGSFEDAGSGLTSSYNNVFKKADGCKSLIDTFSVTNTVKVYEPVTVDIVTNLDAKTYSAFSRIRNNVGFFPGNRDHYSAETKVTLKIFDSGGNLVYQDSKTLNIFMDTAERVSFTWTPTTTGTYTAEVSTDITDCQCESSISQSASKIFTVVPANNGNFCYTLLNELSVNNPNPQAGDFLTLTAKKISNSKDASGTLTPLPTSIGVTVQKGSSVVFSSNTILPPNTDPTTFKEFSIDTTILEAGQYSINMNANALGCTFATNNAESEGILFNAVTPTQINRVPVFDTIGNKNVNEGQLLQFTVNAIDPDNDPLAFSASNLPSGASFDTATRTFSWTPSLSQSGSYSVTFTVSDGKSSNPQTITITVNDVPIVVQNTAPTLNPIGNKNVNEGQLLQFSVSGSDPENNSLTFSINGLPSGASFSSQVFSWTPTLLQSGLYSVTFSVSDGTLTDSETITITVNNANQAPTASNSVFTTNEDNPVNTIVTVSDADGDSLSIIIVSGPSSGVLSGSGPSRTYTPNANFFGTDSYTFKANDGTADSNTATITINVNSVNDAPVSAIPDRTANEDAGFLDNLVDLFSFVFDIETAVASLIFSITSESSTNVVDCSLDINRYVDCTTQTNANGFSDVTVSSTDSGGLTTFDTFRINIIGVNDAPFVDILEPVSKVTEDVEFNLIATATDVDSALTYTIDFGDGKTKAGTVSNNKIQEKHEYEVDGRYTITVTVFDGSLTATDSITVSTEEAQPLDVREIVHINSISFDNDFVNPGDQLIMFVNFENNGQIGLNDIRLTAIIQELGIRSPTSKVAVDNGQEVSEAIILEIPANADPGRYDVELVIDIDGKRRIKFRPIDII